jgi:hypothetical protein
VSPRLRSKANYPSIRLFHVQKISADYPQYDVKATSWTSVARQSVADFYGVAYFFATEVQADQKVPIGLIEADWGGTPAETWTSQRALAADGSLMVSTRYPAAIAAAFCFAATVQTSGHYPSAI